MRQPPEFNPRWTTPFGTPWPVIAMSHSAYDWLRNFHGLIPLRLSCLSHCWMSDAAWTEWKNYSRPRSNYVAWLPDGTPSSVYKQKTNGMRWLYVNVLLLSEMSIRALKNVRQLSISKSLTCDALSVSLSSNSGSVRRPSRQFVYGSVDSGKYGRTFWPSSEPFNGSQLSTDEFIPKPAMLWSEPGSDPLQDIRDLVRKVRMENSRDMQF